MTRSVNTLSSPQDGTFRLFFESAPIGMLLVDQSGEIVLVNSLVETLVGYTREELIGQSVELLVPAAARINHKNFRETFSCEPQTRAMGAGRDLFAVSKDGVEVPVEIGLKPIRTESGTFVLASIVDITERQRAQELQRARDQALQESKLKSAFVANISHELRTPVSSIIGMNELLLSSDLGCEQKMLAEAIRDAGQSLLNLINDLLDISKIEAGRITLKYAPFSVVSLIQDSIRMFDDSTRSKRLTLATRIDYSIPDYLIGDPERVRQVLVNLLGNAIKFTDKGSVTIEVSMLSDSNTEVLVNFAVKDTGIGISEESKGLLFQPFSQLDSSCKRRFSGTGLGLSISKALVEVMGGEISVESMVGQGSTFSFKLPLQKLNQHAPEQRLKLDSIGNTPPDTSNLIANKLVLVVEDNPTLRSLAHKQLTMIGVTPHCASTGNQAVEAAKQISFDLILMDCNLPELDGFEATKRIREIDHDRGRHTPIIAMTAACMTGDLRRCMEAGMDDYLMKPVTIAQLKEQLRKWLLLEHVKEK